jgi:hypothetical protein
VFIKTIFVALVSAPVVHSLFVLPPFAAAFGSAVEQLPPLGMQVIWQEFLNEV